MKKIFMYLCIPLLVLGMASCDKDKEPAAPEGDGTEQTPGTDAPSGEVQPDGITYYYVNLGLPSGLLWASANVGSEKPAAPGKYISWGETKPKTEYWTDKWYNDDLGRTKYCTNESDGEVDNLTRLEQADDAASANMGGKWRMPTAEEFEELLENCSYIETTLDGFKVIVFESKINDNRLVFPITHIKEFDDINMDGYVSCWSSDVDLTENGNAQILLCGYDEYGMDIINRSRGLQVRGVLDAEYKNTATMLPESEYPVLPEEGEGEPVDPLTLYFVNIDDWSAVNAYAWLDGVDNSAIKTWPGEPATLTEEKANEKDVYSYTFDAAKADRIIFNDGSSNQTDDLTFEASKPYFYKDAWYASLEEIPAPERPKTYYKGHEYIDMGYGVCWAAYNVGATSAIEKGNFYAWGETAPKAEGEYKWNYYKWSAHVNNNAYELTKYCYDAEFGYNGYTDSNRAVDREDYPDVDNWPGKWTFPTESDMADLVDPEKSTVQFGYDSTTVAGTARGVKITSKKNGNVLFFPYTGVIENGWLYDDFRKVAIWGNHLPGDSRPQEQNPSKVVYLNMNINQAIETKRVHLMDRCNGMPVRYMVYTSQLD